MNPWGEGSVWKTEKDFLNWLRSQTRRIWSRHPVKISYKMSRRYKAPIGIKGKDVWACKCEMCGKEVRSSDAEIDHITAGGSFRNWEEYTQWAKRILWVTWEDLRELCTDCHQAVTLSQKLGVSFEIAEATKKAIQLEKAKTDKAYILEKGETPERNAKLRREQLVRLILGGRR